MNVDLVKLIIHNMELLLQSLKNELESTESTETVVIPKEKYVMPTKYEDYDEIFEDEL